MAEERVHKPSRDWLWLFALTAIATTLTLVAQCASAQTGNRGDGHAEHHEWYRHLKTKSGWSCYNAQTPEDPYGDCRPVQARSRDDGQWEAYFNGSWQIVPPDAILRDELNMVPIHAHICERGNFIYCFLKGGGGS